MTSSSTNEELQPPVLPMEHDSHSPSSSENSQDTPFTLTNTSALSRSGTSKKEEEVCLICGDRASGYHYNALSCEGCKGFFRRSVTREAVYSCKYGGQCEMDMWMRRKCQFCRLRRCREVGMREECLLSDEQCRARQYRRKSNKTVTESVDHQREPGPSSTCNLDLGDPFDRLSREHQELIGLLVEMQDTYELPNPDKIPKITVEELLGRGVAFHEAIFQVMSSHMLIVTELIVSFAKELPGFKDIHREDQISLLKGSANEIVMLRLARRYDPAADTVVFPDGKTYTCEQMSMIGDPEIYQEMFSFCRKLSELQLDNADYAIITAICIFQERDEQLQCAKSVESAQNVYVDALRSYTDAKCLPASHLASLLMLLTYLRELGHKHMKMMSNLKAHKEVPKLLEEYFNIDSETTCSSDKS